MKTWLLVAAERREFAGLRKCMGGAVESALDWPGVKFARETEFKGDRWWMIANGPGRNLVEQALPETVAERISLENVNGIMSTGLCGALDPALRIGDIVVAAGQPETAKRFVIGEMHSSATVVVTSREKRKLRNQTGAIAVDMESAAIAECAVQWGVPYYCIRAVSDSAGDDLPLDFNQYRDARGDFSRAKIAVAAISKPFTVLPRLLEFDRNCRFAAENLGAFLADCQF